jgi:molecular chaperone GrpE
MVQEEDEHANNQTASERVNLKETTSDDIDGAERPADQPDVGAQEPAADEQPKGEEHGSRMNAAKAFYRAMYAGEEVQPNDFGMNNVGMKSVPAQGQAASGPCSNCQYMENQLAELEAKNNQLENHTKRLAADFDNFRKRTEREKEELLSLGAQRAIESLLPAVDDLDRAQSTFTEDSTPRSIVDTLKLIYNRFLKCLEQLGVTSMDVVGQPFDPKFHEPVQQIETSDWPEGAIVQDLRRGYLMQDKVIRPSLVNVATNPSVEVEDTKEAEHPPAPEDVPAVENVREEETELQAASEEPQEVAHDLAAEEAEASERRRQELANAGAEEQRRLRDEALNQMAASATAEIPAYGARSDINLHAGHELRTRKPDAEKKRSKEHADEEGKPESHHDADKGHGKRKTAKASDKSSEEHDEKETHEKETHEKATS